MIIDSDETLIDACRALNAAYDLREKNAKLLAAAKHQTPQDEKRIATLRWLAQEVEEAIHALYNVWQKFGGEQ